MTAALASDPGIVVIGAGEAGLRAALTVRGHGFEGPVTVIGGEPHAPYERPPLSKQLLVHAGAAPPSISGTEHLVSTGVRLLMGVDALALDRVQKAVSLSDGRALPYRRLLIATGARARSLDVEGGHLARTLRRLDDALAIRDALASCSSLLVIGGGFIGLELAAAASSRGMKVTVAEAAPRILGRATPESVAAIVAGWHQRAGTEILTGKALGRICARPHGFEAEFTDGDGRIADLVVAGVGALPETRLAEAAGLAIDNGIAVDGRLQTSDPFIYAAGDCASFPHPLFDGRRLRQEAWRNAQDQGAFVGQSLLGGAADYDAVPWFWSDQYDSVLQVAGLPSAGAVVVERNPGEEARLTFHLNLDGRLVGAAGAGPLGLVARDIRIAERMIAQRLAPDPSALADSGVPMKTLLSGKRDRLAMA
jgi:3-phenylpropionate/trans-cinnamate dioxygenase ferredoxin reductase component